MRTWQWHNSGMRPRLGVLAHAPIQYHTPLWQLLAKRRNVEVDILFLSDLGVTPINTPDFASTFTWDIDLLSGYEHTFLATAERPGSRSKNLSALGCWLPSHDVVVINGYSSPWMLLAMVLCRFRNVPYLLRGSSHPDGPAPGYRRQLRNAVAGLAVSGSAGGLSMGQLNHEFYIQNRAPMITFAPNSVDDERFGAPPAVSRPNLLARWGLDTTRPVVMFSGKLIPRKRPLDLAAAVSRLPDEVSVMFVGDGPLAGEIRNALPKERAVVTGFVNQSDLPSYYHAADVLVLPSEFEAWGMVVNEAMAAGALPVVSDQVGCAPDLAAGVGEVFRFGDVDALAEALSRALARMTDPGTRERARTHAARYSLERTAEGFEQACSAVTEARRVRSAHRSG